MLTSKTILNTKKYGSKTHKIMKKILYPAKLSIKHEGKNNLK